MKIRLPPFGTIVRPFPEGLSEEGETAVDQGREGEGRGGWGQFGGEGEKNFFLGGGLFFREKEFSSPRPPLRRKPLF